MEWIAMEAYNLTDGDPRWLCPSEFNSYRFYCRESITGCRDRAFIEEKIHNDIPVKIDLKLYLFVTPRKNTRCTNE
jgi:hypothetical protein